MSEMKQYRITAIRSEYVIVEATNEGEAYAEAEALLEDLMFGTWDETEIFEESMYH